MRLAAAVTVCALAATPGWSRAAAPAPLFGPPTLCWPLEIGEARSLPFGAEPFETAPGLAPADVPARALALLDDEAAADVRMETLRRAVVYVSRIGQRGEPAQLAIARAALLSGLKDRVLRAAADGQAAPGAWFDLGYALAALREADAPTTPDGRGKWSCDAALDADRYLRAAVAAAPDDAGLRFGAALAGAGLRGFAAAPSERHTHALAALRGAPEGSRLRRNVCSHLGNLYGAHEPDALAAACRAQLAATPTARAR